ncbi:hypothetical protein DHEL01_v211593 [Diaporthe helianthi]|uniref:G-patch domain-containing protein n=1 Tax=Diaporthe helianthi TaxID=158607 RepID=A0A2P5HID4_DIAHE|nr:hypothetical protein DHEL01_v211593 [Diaporthe helianthi]
MRPFRSKAAGSLGRQSSSVDEADDPTASASPPDVDRSEDADAGKTAAREDEAEEEEEEEEDHYMNMTFEDPPAKQPESSLQRSQRLRREGLRRGIIPSKAELAAQERQKREEGLSRSLITGEAGMAAPPAAGKPKTKSKGLAMMAKMGFTPGSALGSRDNPSARSEPLRIETKEDRGGIGADADKKRKLAEAAEAAGVAKRARLEELGDYRLRMAKERDAARKEKLVFAAQKIAEKMDEDRGAASQANPVTSGRAKAVSSRPLKSVPVVYRGLIRRRDEAERDRRMRYDLEQGSGGLSSKLPAYDDDDDGMDDDDKTAFMPADDLDDEDRELDEFEALEVGDKLAGLVAYLRERHQYCFWCKLAYPDDDMEGCPGLTEEDHD